MRPVLKAAVQPLWRSATSVQLRLDPEHSLVLSGLSAAEGALLSRLDGSVDTADLDGAAIRTGLRASRLRQLLGLLTAAGLVDDAGGTPLLPGWSPAARAQVAPDLAAAGLLHAPDTRGGARVLRRRAGRWVEIHGAGRVGSSIARLLSAAGLGRVTVEDQARTTPGDISPGGLQPDSVGVPRGRAAELAACMDSPLPDGFALAVRPPLPARPDVPDLVVLAPEARPDPVLVERLLRDGTPHLLAVMRETSVVLGPLVLPGRTACLRCLDLHRSDRDPAWPVVAAQLLQPETGHESGPRSGGPRVPACDVVLAGLGAAGAAALVLAHLDGADDNPAHNGTLEHCLPFGLLRRRSWSPHPACGCCWDHDIESEQADEEGAAARTR